MHWGWRLGLLMTFKNVWWEVFSSLVVFLQKVVLICGVIIWIQVLPNCTLCTLWLKMWSFLPPCHDQPLPHTEQRGYPNLNCSLQTISWNKHVLSPSVPLSYFSESNEKTDTVRGKLHSRKLVGILNDLRFDKKSMGYMVYIWYLYSQKFQNYFKNLYYLSQCWCALLFGNKWTH